MGVVVLIGRILFASLFLGSALGHFSQTSDFAGYAEVRGVRKARLWVQISGVVILLGGLGLVFGVWADLSALALATFALAVAIFVHHPWTDEGDTQQVEFTQFMKNVALAGAGIVLWVLIGYAGSELPLTVTPPLFDFSL